MREGVDAKTQLDPTIVERYAEHLARRASARIMAYTIVCALIGAFLGSVPLVAPNRVLIPHVLGLALLLVGAAAGGYLGYTIGVRRAEGLRLQAQVTLHQLQVELLLIQPAGTVPAPAPAVSAATQVVPPAPVAPAPAPVVAVAPVVPAPVPAAVAPAPVVTATPPPVAPPVVQAPPVVAPAPLAAPPAVRPAMPPLSAPAPATHPQPVEPPVAAALPQVPVADAPPQVPVADAPAQPDFAQPLAAAPEPPPAPRLVEAPPASPPLQMPPISVER